MGSETNCVGQQDQPDRIRFWGVETIRTRLPGFRQLFLRVCPVRLAVSICVLSFVPPNPDSDREKRTKHRYKRANRITEACTHLRVFCNANLSDHQLVYRNGGGERR